MKMIPLAVTLVAALASQAYAADPELSIDTRRMLSYGTLAVMTGICKPTLSPGQDTAIKTGLEKAAQAQQDMSQDQFTEAMKAVGTQVGQNKDQVCASLTPEFVATSLQQAAAGE